MSKTLKILPIKEMKESKRKKKKNNPILPQPPFLCCLVAGVSSGKSTFIMNCLYNKNFYSNYFDTIYWFSPSVHNDKTTRFVNDDPSIITVSEKLDQLDQLLLGIVEHQVKTENEDDVLVILDDCLGYLRSGGIEKLCAKFRHYHISLFISVQSWKALPVVCRYNTQYWLIWKLNNKKMFDAINEEMIQLFPDFEQYYKEATKNKYSFAFCDMKNGIIRKNFDEILYK